MKNYPPLLHARLRAGYSSIVSDDSRWVLLRDLNWPGALSVTNDAEAVVERTIACYGGDRRIAYFDSEGELSELQHDGIKFTRFAPLSPLDRLRAQDLLGP